MLNNGNVQFLRDVRKSFVVKRGSEMDFFLAKVSYKLMIRVHFDDFSYHQFN